LRDAGELVLQGPQVTDEWLKYVASMSQLPMLTVKRAKVTDEGLKHLADLKELSVLSLVHVPVSDRAIETLRQLQGVDKFRIYGGNLTAAGVDKLRQDLPNSDIDYRRGAFLGVGCQDGAEGCIIYTVRPDSAAEKAGLLMHDVILEYDGQKIADYKTLIALIAANVAGDTVTVKVVREGQTLSKRVTLGEWE
jgi:membrane-associated protease RseP (regulator of RpoE activity)